MAYYDTCWYCNAGDQSTTGYYAVTLRPQNTAVVAGALRRQFTAPAVNSERVFICIVAGTTANTVDATWVLTRGAKTTDGTATWMECTGIAAVNGDKTNTLNWTQAKAAGGVPSLGMTIQRNNGASYQICTTAGSMGASEPAFSDTAGVTTTDSSAVWTSLGVVGNFTGGQAPHARFANFFAAGWFVQSNTVYVGDNHAESQATAITLNPPSTGSGISRIICHNHSGPYPPTSVATGASVTTTGYVTTTFSQQIPLYFYGIAFRAGVGQSGAGNFISIAPTMTGGLTYFDHCSLEVASTGANSNIQVGSTTGSNQGTVIFNNTTVKFANAGDYITYLLGQFIWQNTGQVLVSGSSVPTTFLQSINANATIHDIVFEALDLSQLTGALWGTAYAEVGNLLIKDCKLNASSSIPSPINTGMTVQVVRCDSGAAGYKSARYAYEGTETTETSITRVGGAVDPTGQAQSRKIVTTANSQWLRPFKAEPYAIWNPTTGANVTVTVVGNALAGALPNNDDIWLEVEYLGSSASPLGTIVTTTKANVLAAGSAVASDSSTWNGTGPVSATFDGTSVNATLSNGNLTATHSNTTTNSGARSTFVKTSGKYYFEATFGTTPTSGDCVGIMQNASAFSDPVTSGVNCSCAYGTGGVYSNDVSTLVVLGAFAAGHVLSVAIDFDNAKCWFRRDGGTWNLGIASGDPVAGTGSSPIKTPSAGYVPFAGFTTGGSGNNVTMNFGATAFAYTPPSGFGNWTFAPIFTPFKLTTTLSSPQPGMAGYLHARVRAAKPSVTYYLDPQITLS